MRKYVIVMELGDGTLVEEGELNASLRRRCGSDAMTATATLTVRFAEWAKVHAAMWPDNVLPSRRNFERARRLARHFWLATVKRQH